MYKLIYSLLVCTLLSTFSEAQSFYHSNYSWEKTPKVYVPTEAEKKSDMVIVLEKKIHEVVYDSDGQASVYETIHTIYHVNSPKAVDGVNKGYMAHRGVLEEIDLKARCITGDNKVIYFNKSSVKSVDNLEGAGSYKIFAIDGVEAGCDVEILYTNKKSFSSYMYYYVQGTAPVAHYEMHIISPQNLIFETKSYNGLDNFKSDTTNKDKNHLYLIQKNIPGAESEKYSLAKAYKMAYIFQLTYNTDKKKSRIYTWDVISQEYYSSLFVVEKGTAKQIEKILKKASVSTLATDAEKVAALDSYVKTNYEINESYDMPIDKGIDNKKLSEANVLIFYIAALKSMGINFEMAVSTNRDDFHFDTKFASYLYMKEFLIYVPSIKKYLSPTSIFSRVGYPDPNLLGNDGIFIKEVNIGDISSSTAKTKPIPVNDFNDSYHNYEVDAKLDFANKNVKLNVTQYVFGYLAYYIQPVYRYLKEEQKEEYNKNYHLSTNQEGIKNFEVLNTGEEELFKKPMIIKYTADQNDFLENAGNKFIFKVGLLIGPQAELYQEDQRKTPADMNYAHYLKRTLEVNIPEGYKATNLSDLNIEKVCLLDGKDIATFKSSYEIKNNKIIINVYEDYKMIEYPLNLFNDLKAVINAAADFNKKNIIFEKQ